jgi:hypothetical protein
MDQQLATTICFVKKGLLKLRQDLREEFSNIDLNRIGGDWWRLKDDGSYTLPKPMQDSPLGKVKISQEKKIVIDDYHLRLAIVAYCAGNEFLLKNNNRTALKSFSDNYANWLGNKNTITMRDRHSGSKNSAQACISKDDLDAELGKRGASVKKIASSLSKSKTQIYRLIEQYGLKKPSERK